MPAGSSTIVRIEPGSRRTKQALHEIYGADGWQIPRLLAEIDAAEAFSFGSISQIVMAS